MVFVYYRDKQLLWRWRLLAANQRILADSAESYVSERDCLHGISLVKGAGTAPIRKI